VWAREQLVRCKQSEDLFLRVSEVFDDRFDEGRSLELSREDAVVPALQSCGE
jgi:hypothetical protein